jgi:hypothetical protein
MPEEESFLCTNADCKHPLALHDVIVEVNDKTGEHVIQMICKVCLGNDKDGICYDETESFE